MAFFFLTFLKINCVDIAYRTVSIDREGKSLFLHIIFFMDSINRATNKQTRKYLFLSTFHFWEFRNKRFNYIH